MVEGHRDSPWSSAAWKPPSHGPTHDRLATSPHAPNRFDQTEHTKLANAFPTDLISRCPTFSPPYPRLMHPSLAHRLLRPLLNRTSPWMTFFVDSGGVGQVLGIICRRGRSRGGPASPTAGLPCVRSKKPPRPLLLGTASIYSEKSENRRGRCRWNQGHDCIVGAWEQGVAVVRCLAAMGSS